MRADGVRPERRIDPPVGDVEVRVVRRQIVAVRVGPIVGPARGTLPFELAAQAGARHAAGLPQPAQVALDVGGRGARDREVEPVLAGAPVAPGVDERLPARAV